MFGGAVLWSVLGVAQHAMVVSATKPLVALALGIACVLGMIILLRINAFISLITAAMLVSLFIPERTELPPRFTMVAQAFGDAAGKIGVVIALAAVIGKCMMDSGAADRIVRGFLRLLGERQAATGLLCSGFVLAVPVFFDTVFYLLVPLARSLYRRTRRSYVLYVLAIAAGGAITHTLVPPTPGPLAMAAELGIDLGVMIVVGTVVAVPAAIAGLAFCHLMNRLSPVPMRPLPGEREDEAPLPDEQLPGLLVSGLPIVLPVLLITANTVVKTLAEQSGDGSVWHTLSPWTQLVGDANFALWLSAGIALAVYVRQRRPTLGQMAENVELALMSGGVIILITAAGGAFGAMLKAAQVGDAIQGLFATSGHLDGILLLSLGFAIAAVLKVAQGSSTVAMITTASMVAAMLGDTTMLSFHPVYLATAIGAGSLVGSWMNDSGFWIFAKMSGFTETESLKTWTVLLVVLAAVSFAVSVALMYLVPLR